MKRVGKYIKIIFAIVLTVVLMVPVESVSAKTKVTDAQLKEVMKCYKNILATNPYESGEGGFTAETFLLKDLDKDGIPELIINGEAPQIFSYNLKDEHEMFIYNSWIYNEMYYSSKTKTLLNEYGMNGSKCWNFYQVKQTQENDVYGVLKGLEDSYSYTNGKYSEGSTCKATKGYYIGNYYSEDAKKTTKKVVVSAIGKLVPDKVKLETTIKNTEANRKKYFDSLKKFKKYAK